MTASVADAGVPGRVTASTMWKFVIQTEDSAW